MQIVFFNINHANTDKIGITDFLEKYKQHTQVFCLQEASDVGEWVIDPILTNFNKITCYKRITDPDTFHLATYIQKGVELKKTEILMEKYTNLSPGIYSEISHNNKIFNILNYHGLSRPVDKLDCPDRLAGSKEIIRFFNNLSGTKIIGGDFNLFPNTKSIEVFEEAEYINLIKKFGITSTRNEVAWKKFPDNKHYYSDYIFVDIESKVKSVEVPYSEISDHLPLILNITNS